MMICWAVKERFDSKVEAIIKVARGLKIPWPCYRRSKGIYL